MPTSTQQRGLDTSSDPRWAAVVARDSRADGRFFYSVKTTGVYCRPSCPARLAKPENVQFHETREKAEQAGFRPCKRCRPDNLSLREQHARMIEMACKYIENSDTVPDLDELAGYVGLSPYYFHRVFRSATGLTPRKYAVAVRAGRFRDELKKSITVTDAVFAAGYISNSRMYETSQQVLGMTPTNYRKGGANIKIHFAIGECSLGSILVARTRLGVCAIFLGDDPEELLCELQNRFPGASLVGGDSDFEDVIAKVVGFVEAPAVGLDLPLDIRGTAFQQRVWQALREIAPGETASYSEIARRIGAPTSARAVAQACALNRIAVAIPCHRVVRKDGGLSGYRWGVDRKRRLLQREKKDGD